MTIYDASVRQSGLRRSRIVRGQKRSYRLTLPAPLQGLNTTSTVNNLTQTEAYELVNFVPDVGSLKIREGSSLYATAADRILGLMTWSYQGSDRLIWAYRTGTATAGLAVYDGSASYSGTLYGQQWQSAMMNGLLGMVNGTDNPIIYSGAVYPGFFTDMPISGPTATNFRGLKVHKSRSYFWGRETGFWYSAVNALGGALTYFPLDTVSQRGGQISSINTWTLDSGSGPDDFFVVTMRSGEVIVYQGSNPSDPNDWALVGRYMIAPPVSKSGFLELDGKILVLTNTDLEVLPDKFIRQRGPSPLSGAVRRYVNDVGAPNSGCTLFYDFVRDRVIASMFVSQDEINHLVRTPVGYTSFQGVDSNLFTSYNNEVYFANGSSVYRWGGGKDRGTELVPFSAKTGYQLLGTGNEKRVAMYRPHVRSQGTVTMDTALSFDCSGIYTPVQSVSLQGFGTPWGSTWDSEWDSGNQDRGDWLVGVGTGQSVSMSISGDSLAGMEWIATDYEVVPGGLY